MLPTENYILSEIRYKQDKNYMEISALQLVFANGVESPLFEAIDGPNETLKSVTIDTSRKLFRDI